MTTSLSGTFTSRAEDLTRALEQETEPQYLLLHAQRFVAPIVQATLEAIDTDVLPGCRALRAPLALMLRVADSKPLSSTTESDDQLLGAWLLFITPWIRERRPRLLTADPGRADFYDVQRDADGRPVGKDGLPLVPVYHDPSNSTRGWQLSGKPISVSDNFSDEKLKSEMRMRVIDWRDCTLALAVLVGEARTEPSDTSQPEPAGTPAMPELWTSAAEATRMAQELTGNDRDYASFWRRFFLDETHGVKTQPASLKDGTQATGRRDVDKVSLYFALEKHMTEIDARTPEDTKQRIRVRENLREKHFDTALSEIVDDVNRGNK